MTGRRRTFQATPVQPKSPERIPMPHAEIRSRAEVAKARALRDSWPKTPPFEPPELPSAPDPEPEVVVTPSDTAAAPEPASPVTVAEPHPKLVTKAAWLSPKSGRRTAK
jgi:hypothetical protein